MAGLTRCLLQGLTAVFLAIGVCWASQSQTEEQAASTKRDVSRRWAARSEL
jgi:hypothetical protein